MGKKKKKVQQTSKFEKLLYTLAIFLLVIAPVSIVFSKATLAKVNFEVEKPGSLTRSPTNMMSMYRADYEISFL